MSSIDTLVYGELLSWHDLVVYGRVPSYAFIPGRANVISSVLWTTTRGWITLGAHPHQCLFVRNTKVNKPVFL